MDGRSLLAIRLKELCEADCAYQEKYQRYQAVIKDLTDNLTVVSNFFPHFSRHDASHSATISMMIGRLLGEARIKELSVSDLMLMQLSYYAHDIGMVLCYRDIRDEMTKDKIKEMLDGYAHSQQGDLAAAAQRLLHLQENDTCIELNEQYNVLDVYADVIQVIEEEYRGNHAERSAEKIKDHVLEKLLGRRICRLLAGICAAHGRSIEAVLQLPKENLGLFGDDIHPRFVAAMLCIGDLLDMDTERFDEMNLKATTQMPELSKKHYHKQQSLTGLAVNDSRIDVTADCDDIMECRIMQQWLEWLSKGCEFVSVHWNEIAQDGFGTPPYVRTKEVLLKHSRKWLQYTNMKIHISSEYALELLQGTGLYKHHGKVVFLREIIQNAVDATVLRLYQDIADGHRNQAEEWKLIDCLREKSDWERYKVEGKITLDNEKNQIEITLRDHGIGIFADDIARIALCTGKSKEMKEQIKKMPVWFRPSGIFSIGLQSIFAAADSFDITTRTSFELPKKIYFERSPGYIQVEDVKNDMDMGSEIHIVINPDKFTQKDLNTSDYFYRTCKLELIFNTLLHELNYIHKPGTPAAETSRQCYDYVPVSVSAQCNRPPYCVYDDEALHYETIFSDEDVFKQADYVKLDVQKHSVRYYKFDDEQNCIFKGELSFLSGKEIAEGTDDRMRSNMIFYRNALVKKYEVGPFRPGRSILGQVQFHLNLLTAQANEVLSLNRNEIRDDYNAELSALIGDETSQMYQRMIDYAINPEQKPSAEWLILLYQYALQYDYKKDDLYSKNESTLQNIKIGGYYAVDGHDNAGTEQMISIDFKTLKTSHLILLDAITEKESQDNGLTDEACSELEIPESCYKEPLKAEIEGHGRHLLQHKLLKESFCRYKGKKYHMYEVEPFSAGKKEEVELSEFIRYDEFLCVLGGNLRCVHACAGFEELLTPERSDGRYMEWRASTGKSVEFMLAPEIKAAICEELRKNGSIPNAVKVYADKIFATEIFERNVKFIYDEAVCYRGAAAKSSAYIEKLYRSFVKKQLSLIETDPYHGYVQKRLAQLENTGSMPRTMMLHANNLHSYIVFQ